jgi:hypothetical protein
MRIATQNSSNAMHDRERQQTPGNLKIHTLCLAPGAFFKKFAASTITQQRRARQVWLMQQVHWFGVPFIL